MKSTSLPVKDGKVFRPLPGACEKGGIFIVPNLLWHRTSLFAISSEGPLHLVAFYVKEGILKTQFNPDSHETWTKESKYGSSIIYGIDCLLIEGFRPFGEFLLIWRRHHYRWRAANFDLCSALMAIKQWGSLACHTFCDTRHPFIMVISEYP